MIFTVTTIFMISLSCRKEQPGRNNPIPAYIQYANKAPVANAGPDIIIRQAACASLHFTNLVGSASFDPDNNIRTFHWKKIAGPPDGLLTNNGDDTAIYVEIRRGLYSFELTVTDSTGLASKDTMVVDADEWSLPSYELNVTLNGSYRFEDNYEDCSDFPDCTYFDWVSLNCTGVDPQLGDFNFTAGEMADTSLTGSSYFNSMRLEARDGMSPYNRHISGSSTVFIKQLIQNGGGAFTGLYNINQGTAESCDRSIYLNTVPLTITGHIDTSSKLISMRITGTTYF